MNDRNDHFIESEDNPDDKSAGVSQIMQQIVGIDVYKRQISSLPFVN